jgi:hypothetical protein
VNYVEKRPEQGLERSALRSDKRRTRQTRKVTATKPESLHSLTSREKRRLAGLLKMDWKHFLLFNALGAAPWLTVVATVGFFFGHSLESIFATRVG